MCIYVSIEEEQFTSFDGSIFSRSKYSSVTQFINRQIDYVYNYLEWYKIQYKKIGLGGILEENNHDGRGDTYIMRNHKYIYICI